VGWRDWGRSVAGAPPCAPTLAIPVWSPGRTNGRYGLSSFGGASTGSGQARDDASRTSAWAEWARRYAKLAARPKWRNGRRGGLKNRWGESPVWVRIPPSAPTRSPPLRPWRPRPCAGARPARARTSFDGGPRPPAVSRSPSARAPSIWARYPLIRSTSVDDSHSLPSAGRSPFRYNSRTRFRPEVSFVEHPRGSPPR
jgi:hypothetical protein